MTGQGLSSGEAAARLKRHGANELPRPAQRDLARIAFDVVRQPMFAMLLAAGGIYALLGEPVDAFVLLLFATLSVSISIIQEARSEHVLESLRTLASPRALVMRDGERVRIPGREVVPGDLMILAEGDRVPADALVESAADLAVDESILTGESQPVRKQAGAARPDAAPGGEDNPHIFAGTLVVRGTAQARVTGTGHNTELGRIGLSLRTIALEQPRLQRQLRWLVRDFAIFGVIVAVLVVLLLGVRDGAWLQALLAGIAVGMSALPEEFPLVLAVFMAMGAWRISRAHVLTRHAAAIETLGSATVLCSDKTGTMTQNRMRVQALATMQHVWRDNAERPPDTLTPVLEAAGRASALHPTDPMDRALIAALADGSGPTGMEGDLVHSYGLRPELPAMANVWDHGDGADYKVYVKGAPEAVAALCAISGEPRDAVFRQVDELARDGMRVLAVAEARFDPASGPLPNQQHGFAFRYLGLVGFADPLRENVPRAVADCRAAGIRVIMITGDYPLTAQAIARQAGLDDTTTVSGNALAGMSDAELARQVRTASVFCRIRPAQKLRIVESLKANGEIVAMTGDGVNDAPAMRAAHIGIAMGQRGTDVAREAASLVLLNDDFVSIVATIRLGRRIYDNLRKAIQYIVAVHIPIAGLAILPLLIGLPAMLTPIQIAFLEMVIDPACSVVFEGENEEDDIMRRPPRAPDQPVLPRTIAVWAALQGLAALLLVGAALAGGIALGLAAPDLRALAFTVLVLMNVGLILVNRSFDSSLYGAIARPNPALRLLAAAVLVLLGCALYLEPARRLFHFGILPAQGLLAALAISLLLIAILETAKHRLLRIGPRLRDAMQ
jgi:Ca2+-transporting ATPase